MESAAQSRSVSIFPSKCIFVPSGVSSSLQVFLDRLFRCSPEPAIPCPSLHRTPSEYKSLSTQELALAVLIGRLLAAIIGKVLAPLLVHAPVEADRLLDSPSRRAAENSSINGHTPGLHRPS